MFRRSLVMRTQGFAVRACKHAGAPAQKVAPLIDQYYESRESHWKSALLASESHRKSEALLWRELVDTSRVQECKAEALLHCARSTLSKRWVLETALRLASITPKFNATETAKALATNNSATAQVMHECARSSGLPLDDVATLYGTLSADIHSAGASLEAIKVPNGLSVPQVDFLLCVAKKLFKIE
jgi:hypothetical protein